MKPPASLFALSDLSRPLSPHKLKLIDHTVHRLFTTFPLDFNISECLLDPLQRGPLLAHLLSPLPPPGKWRPDLQITPNSNPFVARRMGFQRPGHAGSRLILAFQSSCSLVSCPLYTALPAFLSCLLLDGSSLVVPLRRLCLSKVWVAKKKPYQG